MKLIPGANVDLFKWRKVMISEFGPPKPVTRLVLLVLSLHMDKNGESCFPSTKTLQAETGLSERAVCEHLAIAESMGWIKKMVCGLSGRGWKRHKYLPLIPHKALTEGQHLITQGTDRKSVTKVQGTDFHADKALTEGQSSSSYITHHSLSSISSPSSNSIPYDDILNLWRETLPELPQPRGMDGARKKHFRARWNEKRETKSGLKSNDSAFWAYLFKRCRESDFLMGRKTDFRLSFDWLTNKSNLIKVLEGNYHK